MPKLFDVVIERCPHEGDARFELINRLVRVFRVRRELITTIVDTAPRVVKSGVDATTAERFAQAIYSAGAPVKIEHHTAPPPAQGPAQAKPAVAQPAAAPSPEPSAVAPPSSAAPAAAAAPVTVAPDLGAGRPGWLYFRALDVIHWPSTCVSCYDPQPTESVLFGTEAVTQAMSTKALANAAGGAVGNTADLISTLSGGDSGGGMIVKGIASVVGGAVAAVAHPSNGERGSYKLPICKGCLDRLGFLEKGNIAGANDEAETSILDRRFEPPVVQVKFREQRFAAELARLNPGLVCTSQEAAAAVTPISRKGPGSDRDGYQPKAPMAGRGSPLPSRLRAHLELFRPAPGYYLAPDIPPRLLLAARRRCGSSVQEDVLALIDLMALTEKGSGSAAILVVESGLRLRNPRIVRETKPELITFEMLREQPIKRSAARQIRIGESTIELVHTGMSPNEVLDLLSSIQAGLRPEVPGAVRAAPASPADAPPLQTEQRGEAQPDRALDADALVATLRRFEKKATSLHVGDIPAKKLDNGRRVCSVPADETIVGLLDFTVWGSGKAGLLIGLRGIYYTNMIGTTVPGGMLPYGELARREIKKGGFGSVSLDLGSGDELSIPGGVSKETLAKLLQSLQMLALRG